MFLPTLSLRSFCFFMSLSQDRTWLYSHPEEILAEPVAEAYFALIRAVRPGVPTQHLTGKQEFWGLEFEVTPDVLIPRPETEHLIEVALDRLAVREIRAGRQPRLTGENVTLVDIGTGSGCIAITLAKELSAATVYATDHFRCGFGRLPAATRRATVWPSASTSSIQSSRSFSNSSGDRAARGSPAEHEPPAAAFDESRFTSHESRLFDLIISNPPYISLRDADSLPIEVREHEPRTALFGGEEGYELYGALIPQAARHLKPGGLLVLELGYNSLPAVEPLLDRSDWWNVSVTKDLAGIPRVISAERLPPRERR